MKTIDNFNKLFHDNKESGNLMPGMADIFDILPYGITWMYDGIKREIKDNKKMIPLLLKHRTQIALIRAPFDKKENQAYIVDPFGEIQWDIRKIIKNEASNAIFSDVYYVCGKLYFFINLNLHDYRFIFDPENGIAGNMIPSY